MRFGHKNAPDITPADYIERSIVRMPWSGCWIWERAQQSRGYGVLEVNGKGMQAHRFSYSIFIGTLPVGAKVLHRCDVSLCVNPAHLYVGTESQNLRDQYDRQRRPIKLTIDDKRRIVALLAEGRSQQAIADMLGVHKSAIWYWSRKWMT